MVGKVWASLSGDDTGSIAEVNEGLHAILKCVSKKYREDSSSDVMFS